MNGSWYCGRHLRTHALSQLVEAFPLNADEIYAIWDSVRVEAASDLDRLPNADPVAADRPRPQRGNGLPVEDMDGSRRRSQLHRIDHHHQVLAIHYLEEIDPAQTQKH